MAIIRTKRTNNFTVIDNDVYADNRLSFQAMGLLSYLLSKPDDLAIDIADLASATQGTSIPNGQSDIYEMLLELVSHGFVYCKTYPDGTKAYYVSKVMS